MRFARKVIGEIVGEDKMSATLNMDECTARGCAIMCAMLSPQIRVLPFDIKDQVRSPVKLKWQQTNAADAMDVDGRSAGENSLVIFKKTDSFPKEMKLTFKRTKTFQLEAVYNDMSDMPKGASDMIGNFTIKMDNAKAAVAEAIAAGEKPEVRVFIDYDSNGVVGIHRAEFMKKNKQPEPEPEEEEPAAAAADGEKADAKPEADAKKAEGDKAEAEAEADGASKDDSAKKADEDKAEADNAKAEPPAKKKAKKKAKAVPKYTCIQLEVVRSTPFGIVKKQLDDYIHLEATMVNNARILLERDEARNSLESFVYDFRDKLEADELQDFMTEDFKEKYFARLDETEEWLYSEEGFDSTKKVFTGKLAQLHKDGSAVSTRMEEFNARPPALKKLLAAIDEMNAAATSSITDDTKKHWDDADRKIITDACTAADAWLKSTDAKLATLAKTEDSPIKAQQITDREQELRKACRPVVDKKPPPPPAAPKEEKKPEADAKADAGTDKAETETADAEVPETETETAAPADGGAEPEKMDTDA